MYLRFGNKEYYMRRKKQINNILHTRQTGVCQFVGWAHNLRTCMERETFYIKSIEIIPKKEKEEEEKK